jgi:hypothetical protein
MNIRHLGPDAVERLTLDTEPWLSCDDCFRQVDEYVDRLLAGEADPMPAMGVHLRGCPARRRGRDGAGDRRRGRRRGGTGGGLDVGRVGRGSRVTEQNCR